MNFDNITAEDRATLAGTIPEGVIFETPIMGLGNEPVVGESGEVKTLRRVSAAYVRWALTRAFGFEGWRSVIVDAPALREEMGVRYYECRVRLVVGPLGSPESECVVHEAVGMCELPQLPGGFDAIVMAKKGSVSDGLCVAAKNLDMALGNSLYFEPWQLRRLPSDLFAGDGAGMGLSVVSAEPADEPSEEWLEVWRELLELGAAHLPSALEEADIRRAVAAKFGRAPETIDADTLGAYVEEVRVFEAGRKAKTEIIDELLALTTKKRGVDEEKASEDLLRYFAGDGEELASLYDVPAEILGEALDKSKGARSGRRRNGATAEAAAN